MALRPAVAGSFYPADERRLAGLLDDYLSAAKVSARAPRALVVPHAGYIYSGAIAASAYAQLSALKASPPLRIAIFGPSHHVWFEGLCLPAEDAVSTPLGTVTLDVEGLAVASKLPQVLRDNGPHRREHSIEVQLPFLQRTLPGVPVLPFAVGKASPEDVAGVMEALSALPRTLLVVSTDLSHYLSWEEARALDKRTADAVVGLRPEGIAHDQACGSAGLRGLLRFAQKHGLEGELLDLRSSGDTAGEKDRVVGYGAFGFYEGGAR